MASSEVAQQRLAAWSIDMLMVLGLGILLDGLGWLAGTAYWVLRDGCFDGQSVGKRLMGLKVVAGGSGRRCTFRDSAVRNFLWIIPVLNVVMGLLGLHHLIHDPAGRHWGDRLADTRVVKV